MSPVSVASVSCLSTPPPTVPDLPSPPRLHLVGSTPSTRSEVRWGELVDQAGRVLLRRDRVGCGTRAEVQLATTAYHQLLCAVGRAWRELWWVTVAPPAARDLGPLLPRASGPATLIVPTTATLRRLRRSTVLLGSAADLLATHRGRSGRCRAPASEVLDDPAELEAGSVVLARMLWRAARFGTSLAEDVGRLRCRRARFHDTLGDPSILAAAAAELIAAVPPAAGEAAVAALTVARPGMATTGPVELLRSRLERQVHSAWRWRENADVAIETLADLAAWACELQSYAGRRRTWSQLALELADLCSAAPRDRRVHSDLLATRILLARVLPREDALPIVEELLGALPALAAWGWHGFEARYAGDHRSVLIRGRALGEDELDDDEPELITARLRDTVAPAPCWRIDAVRAAYARLCD